MSEWQQVAQTVMSAHGFLPIFSLVEKGTGLSFSTKQIFEEHADVELRWM